jgi:hypothetical protein
MLGVERIVKIGFDKIVKMKTEGMATTRKNLMEWFKRDLILKTSFSTWYWAKIGNKIV